MMINRFRKVAAMIAATSLAAIAPDVSAQDLDDDVAERCVPLSRITRTEVLDDFNILFYMRGSQIYLNRLPNRCIGLKNERTFLYRTSMSRLCDLDIITVIYNNGFGFTPGASCGLGRFHPITKEDVEDLKQPKPIESEVDVPPAEPEEIGNPQ